MLHIVWTARIKMLLLGSIELQFSQTMLPKSSRAIGLDSIQHQFLHQFEQLLVTWPFSWIQFGKETYWLRTLSSGMAYKLETNSSCMLAALRAFAAHFSCIAGS